nr:MAG TPA: ENDO-1,4-BETA-XYLANASE Y DEGRADATION, HYDROLASE, GLYCOSIDASE.2A [Caudoviricetes sp.]
MDALEYGMSWIKAALANRRCAQHDYSCGGTGAEFFVDCPPARAIIPDYTEWVTARTNLATNPAFRVDTTGWVGVAGGGGVVNIKRWNGAAPPEVGTTGYLRMTLATKGSWWYARHVAQPPVTARRTYTLSAWVKGTTSANGYVIVNWYDASGFWISQAFTSSLPISSDGWNRHSFTSKAPAGAATARLDFGRSSGTVGDVYDVTGVLFEEADAVGTYFDGSTPGDPTNRFLWTGEPNASTSIWQTRSTTTRPETDEEYFPRVDAVTRVLHGVSAISGPLEVETVQSSDGRHWGREVEFTLYSEQPGIYSKPRSLGTLVSIGEIVDDVVRNLVPYPSAELSQNKVIVAYNHVTNPSLEVADVNWSGGSFSGSDTPGSPAIGAISRGVVRGARAYAGEASYLTRWLGDGKTVGSGRRELGVEYEQRSMPGLAAGDRVTVTVWGALVVQSGTPITAAETLSASFQWVDANGKVIDGASLGTATGEERGGKVFSLSGLVVPAGTTGIRIHLSTNSMDVYSSPNAAVNRDIRVYADAAGVIEEI